MPVGIIKHPCDTRTYLTLEMVSLLWFSSGDQLTPEQRFSVNPPNFWGISAPLSSCAKKSAETFGNLSSFPIWVTTEGGWGFRVAERCRLELKMTMSSGQGCPLFSTKCAKHSASTTHSHLELTVWIIPPVNVFQSQINWSRDWSLLVSPEVQFEFRKCPFVLPK